MILRATSSAYCDRADRPCRTLTDDVGRALAARLEQRRILAARDDVLGLGDVERWLSRLHWMAGDTRAAEECADAAVEILDGTESIELAMACSNQAHLRMLGGDLAGTRSWAARSLDLLGRLPDSRRRTEVRAHVLTNLGTAEALSGDETIGRQMLEESLAEAVSAELHEHAARARSNLAATAVLHHEHARATAYLEAGIEYCLERDLDTWWTYLQGCRAQLLLDRGEVAAARTCAERRSAPPRRGPAQPDAAPHRHGSGEGARRR